MQQAETVTFGGAGLDRAPHVRADAVALQQAWEQARVLPFWRGRPLTEGDDVASLVWIAAAHPLFAGVTEPIFLGLEGGQPRFAANVSATLTQTDLADSGPFDGRRQGHPALPANQGFTDLRAMMADLSPAQAELAAVGKALLEWHRLHGYCAACGVPSRIALGGWQRHCPACQATHFPRTDPVVIMLVTDGDRVLLGRSPGWPEGMYSLLAGFVEPGETIEAAVRREVAEETGVRLGAVSYLASQPWPFPANLMIGCRAQAISTAITLDPAELDDALWVGRNDMVQVLNGTHPRIRPSRHGSIAQFILNAWLADRLE
ncbi:MAG: NAD(+) diphosphatase [Paracoccaceae bacterium]